MTPYEGKKTSIPSGVMRAKFTRVLPRDIWYVSLKLRQSYEYEIGS